MTCELCDGPLWHKPHWSNGRLIEVCGDCAAETPDDIEPSVPVPGQLDIFDGDA